VTSTHAPVLPEGTDAPAAGSTTPRRLPSLTGMRFLCAALVFAMHSSVLAFFASADTGTTFTAMAYQGGYTGVVYFFILSGFVLTWSARSNDRLGAFWRRRFVKIYPNYLVALVLGMVLTVFVQDQVFNRKWAVLDLLLLQSWSPDVNARGSYNPPLWSLSAEALFYLSFPLLLVLVNKVRPERLWACAGAVIVAIFAVPAIIPLLPPGEAFPEFNTTATEAWVANQLPATRMLEFVLGIVMARIVMTRRRLPVGLGGAVALSVLAYWLASYIPGRFTIAAIMTVPLALVIAAAAAQDSDGRPSVVSGRVWVWLGEISYAFYLVHFLVLSNVRFLLGERSLGTLAGIGLLAGLFVATTGAAALLHHLVERPMMKHFSRSRRSRAEAAAARPAEPTAAEPTAADPRPAERQAA
jgi:peptidoglycan/LPS O-acetylase OafA/YrhL